MIATRLNRRISAAVLAILLSLALVPVAGAEGTIYKWKDKEGNVHYTECPPPPGCKAETVVVKPMPSEQQVRQAKERLDKLLAEQEQSAAGREQGERVFLDDAAHTAEIERQRQLIQDNCDTE